jgi:hypothetical protein
MFFMRKAGEKERRRNNKQQEVRMLEERERNAPNDRVTMMIIIRCNDDGKMQ